MTGADIGFFFTPDELRDFIGVSVFIRSKNLPFVKGKNKLGKITGQIALGFVKRIKRLVGIAFDKVGKVFGGAKPFDGIGQFGHVVVFDFAFEQLF